MGLDRYFRINKYIVYKLSSSYFSVLYFFMGCLYPLRITTEQIKRVALNQEHHEFTSNTISFKKKSKRPRIVCKPTNCWTSKQVKSSCYVKIFENKCWKGNISNKKCNIRIKWENKRERSKNCQPFVKPCALWHSVVVLYGSAGVDDFWKYTYIISF